MRVRLVLFLVALQLSSNTWSERLELEQVLELKWRGLPVATMSFAASIPLAPSHAGQLPGQAKGKATPAERKAPDAVDTQQIEIVGKTRGPLRWLKDYQATVRYVQIGDDSSASAFTLVGTDNGVPEQRDILFLPGQLPLVRQFDDSTAAEALLPQDHWQGNTVNPLAMFRNMLVAAAQRKACSGEAWGYDGKRRYLLRLDSPERELSEPAPRAEAAFGFDCKLTMYAKNRQSAESDGKREPSAIVRRLGGLWPFGDSDRELLFHLTIKPKSPGKAWVQLHVNEVRINTPLGAIIAKAINR